MGINGHACSSVWLLNGIRKRKAKEGLKYKELDTRLYVSIKQKHRVRETDGRDTSPRCICRAKRTKNKCLTQMTLTPSKLNCSEPSEHYQLTGEHVSNTNQRGLCREGLPQRPAQK